MTGQTTAPALADGQGRGSRQKEIRRIDTAQKAQVKELEKTGDADDPATEAWRERIRERFAELLTERKTYTGQLTALTTDHSPQQAPELLNALPTLPGRLEQAKPATRARLYQAFDLQLLYNKEMHQVTIYATITTSTPGAVAAILADSEPPSTPARYPFPLANSSTIGSLRLAGRRPHPPRPTGHGLAAARREWPGRSSVGWRQAADPAGRAADRWIRGRFAGCWSPTGAR